MKANIAEALYLVLNKDGEVSLGEQLLFSVQTSLMDNLCVHIPFLRFECASIARNYNFHQMHPV